jgi:DNA-binding CsgD family transcriptional regulator
MLIHPAALAAVLAEARNEASPAPQGFGLTQREREVLDLMGSGLDPQTIARALNLSVHTSRGHVKSILSKLGAHSQLEAVVVAMKAGLVKDTTGG